MPTREAQERPPSAEQRHSGMYPKRALRFQGLDLRIENERQTARPPDGDREHPSAQHAVPYAYGYLAKTRGADGEEIDCFVGGDESAEKVYVIEQSDNSGKFDEHKVMLGFHSKEEAEIAYRAAYDDNGGHRVRRIKEMTLPELKAFAYKETHDSVRVRFPAHADKGITYDENSQPIMDFLVSGTKLDRTSYVDELGRKVVGEKIAPALLDKMLEQGNGARDPRQQADGVYLIEAHETTIPLGWVVSAEKEDLPDGNWQLHARVQLDPEHPLVPVLIRNVESGKYVPDCSVGLKVLKGTAWDDQEGGYVGFLFDGFWEHLALTKPGHPAYADAGLEGVAWADNFVSAMKEIYTSVQKDVEAANKDGSEVQTLIFDKGKFTAAQAQAWARDNNFAASEPDVTENSIRLRQTDPGKYSRMRTISLTDGVQAVVGFKKDEPANKAATKGEGEMEPVKVTGASLVAKNKDAESELARKEGESDAEFEARKTKEAEARKGKDADATNEAAAEAAADAARKRKEAEIASEKEAEAEAARKAASGKDAEAGKEAEAKKDLPPPAAPAKPAAPPSPGAPPPKTGKDLADTMRNIHRTMKAGIEGGSSPEDLKDLLANMMDEMEEACEVADGLSGGASGDKGALTITHEGAHKESEAEAEARKDAEAKKDAEELVTKSIGDRATRHLLRKMNETIDGLVTSNKELKESNKELSDKLANLDKKPARTGGPLRFADKTAAMLRRQASAEGDSSALETAIKSIEDPQKRDFVSRAVGQDLVMQVLEAQFPALAAAQKEWEEQRAAKK